MECAVLIRKDNEHSQFWSNLMADADRTAPLSPQEVIAQHQGFEGESVMCLCFPEKSNPLVLDAVKMFDKLADENNFLFLYVSSESKTYMDELDTLFSYIGYDYGSFGTEQGRPYSSIFNEILFGRVEKLRSFKDKLNEHLLFPDKPTVEEYVRVHHELSLAEENVEFEEILDIYQIWKRNS